MRRGSNPRSTPTSERKLRINSPAPSRQYQRQRDLDRHQRISEATFPPCDASTRSLEALDHVAPRTVERRRNTEQQGGQDCHTEAEHQRRTIEPELDFSRQGAYRKHPNQRLDPAIRKQTTGGGASERQQQALDHELPQDPAAAGAEGRTNGQLTFTGGGPRQNHIGDIAARDQHEQRDRRQGGEEHTAKIADDRRDDVHDLDVKPLGVLLWMEACAPGCNDIELGLSLLQ